MNGHIVHWIDEWTDGLMDQPLIINSINSCKSSGLDVSIGESHVTASTIHLRA